MSKIDQSIIVKGTRICRECQGICHENSWRTKIGQRRSYWCCEDHLRRTQKRKLLKRLRKFNLRNWQEVGFGATGLPWAAYRDKLWEPVNIIE